MESLAGSANILLAILGFAFVIFIHELGHFLFAKWAGVRVDVFSIGFGPTVWAKTIGETQYRLSLLPFGGYVRMLGMGEDGPVDPSEAERADPRSFLGKHPAWRAAILFGGVLFNLISSWLILVALAFYGMPSFPAQVGSIEQTVVTIVDGERTEVPSPASQLGLRPGDHIRTVNGQPIYDYEDVLFGTLTAGSDPITMEVERDGAVLTLPAEGEVTPVYDPRQGRPSLGMGFRTSRTVFFAWTAGQEEPAIPLKSTIDSVNGESVDGLSGQELAKVLRRSIGSPVSLGLAGVEVPLELVYAGGQQDSAALFGLPVVVTDFASVGKAGESAVQRGDVIHSVNGEAAEGTEQLIALVEKHATGGKPLELGVWRRQADGGWADTAVTHQPVYDAINDRHLIGILQRPLVSGQLPPELPQALGGKAGPLAIAQLAGTTVLGRAAMAADGSLGLRTIDVAETRMLPLAEASWDALDHFTTVGSLAKMVGFQGKQARSLVLDGARILDTGPNKVGFPEPGQLTLWKPDGQGGRSAIVNLADLPEADRAALLSLPEGAWIASTAAWQGGARHLEIAIPAEIDGKAIAPTAHRLQPAAIGTIMGYGIDQQPYELKHWTEAFTLANHKSVQMVVNTLILIPRFFKAGDEGGLDASKSLHGPIGIFSELKARAEHLGFASVLRMVALIGLNLFLINLLPIPITDGGQLMFLGIEVIIRRPVPVMVQNIANYFGLVLIVSLMVYVLGLDIARHVIGG